MSNSDQISDSWEVQGKTSVIAILMGMAILGAAFVLGRTYVFFGGFLAFSLVMTLVWRNAPRPWVYLVSTAAVTPFAIGKQQVSCNLVFAFWSLFLNMKYLFRLPRWLYAFTALAVLGIFSSSMNWMSDEVIRSIMRQGTYAYNFLFAPLLLIPLIYVRMRESTDRAANLQGLLFCLIIPMTLILVAARTFGTVTNAWEASQHVNTQAEGFYLYQLGKAQINFARTDVGFILAALTCASAAIVVTPVRVMQRLIALTCLLTCVFLLLSTGSFGSIAACLCGLTAIFIAQFRSINIVRFIMSLLTIIFMLVLVYLMLPAKTKAYLDKRYEHRIEKKDTDRLILWGRAFDSFVAHPGGVGYTLQAGEEGTVKTWTHNEYLTYFVSYGAAGGLAYAAFVIWLCGSFFLIRKQVSDDPAALAVYLAGLAVLVAASVNSMTDTMSGNRMNYNVIWSMIWYCYFCSQAGQSVIASETREAISVR